MPSHPGLPDRRVRANDAHRTTLETWWTDYRHLVRDVAYRILCSVADAEDVTQDAYLRLPGQDRRGSATRATGS